MCDKVHELKFDDINDNSESPYDQNIVLSNTILGRWVTKPIAAIVRIEWLKANCPGAPASMYQKGWRAYFRA